MGELLLCVCVSVRACVCKCVRECVCVLRACVEKAKLKETISFHESRCNTCCIFMYICHVCARKLGTSHSFNRRLTGNTLICLRLMSTQHHEVHSSRAR